MKHAQLHTTSRPKLSCTRPGSRGRLSARPLCRPVRAVSEEVLSNGLAISYDGDEAGEFCAPAFVTFDNQSDEAATKLSVRVQEYQGLLHVVSWVLKGMDVRVRAATLKTDADGMADDVFHVTTLAGERLSDDRAKEIAERISDFVMHCSPKYTQEPVEWIDGPVHISNAHDDLYTALTVLEVERRVGFLLEIAAVMSGIGVAVKSADVRTCEECSKDPAFEQLGVGQLQGAIKTGRVIKMRLSEMDGSKLHERSVNAVIFTLKLLLGKGHAPTVVPNSMSCAVSFKGDT